MSPTIQMEVNHLSYLSALALKKLRDDADDKWNKKVDEFYSENLTNRWFWIGKLKYPDRESVERKLGDFGDGLMYWDTVYLNIFGDTRETLMYKSFIKAGKSLNTHNKSITLEVSDYNELKSHKDSK